MRAVDSASCRCAFGFKSVLNCSSLGVLNAQSTFRAGTVRALMASWRSLSPPWNSAECSCARSHATCTVNSGYIYQPLQISCHSVLLSARLLGSQRTAWQCCIVYCIATSLSRAVSPRHRNSVNPARLHTRVAFSLLKGCVAGRLQHQAAWQDRDTGLLQPQPAYERICLQRYIGAHFLPHLMLIMFLYA